MPASVLRMPRFSRRVITRSLSLLTAVLPVTLPAQVTNYVWDGSAPSATGNPKWSRAANWASNMAPPVNVVSGLTNTDITFAGSLKPTTQMDENFYVRTLTFNTSATAFTIVPQNTESIFIGAGGILNNSTNTQSLLTTLVLSNSQTWNAAAGNLSILGLVNLGDNTLTLAGANTLTFNDTIIGSGGLFKQGAGNLILAGTTANTFNGGLTIQEGTVTVAKANAAGPGALVVDGGVLNLGNYNHTFSSVALRGGTINSSAGTLFSSSPYQLQSGTINSRLGGTSGVVKTTDGVVILTAANSYTGGTLITGGMLLVNNLSGSGTGTGSVSVRTGGFLAGFGAISGIVTNGPGGSISAGNEIGVLNLGSTVWFGGATNRWDLSDATGVAGTGWDLLNITGTLTLDATTTSKAVIDITSFTLGEVRGLAANFDPTQSYLWTIAQTSGGILFQPGESELTVFDLFSGNFVNSVNGGEFGLALSPDGRNLQVSYTPIPEPGKAVMLGFGLCLFVIARRFKENWATPRR